MALLPRILPRDEAQRRAAIKRKLMHEEAVIGGTLFGPIPKGHHRQFFRVDDRTWIWHEEWDTNGKHNIVTTRYEVRPNVIVKSQNDSAYQVLTREETRNLVKAVGLYADKVGAYYRQVYGV